MAEILTPDCPQCGQSPYMVMGGGSQAFCGNRQCSTLCWNPAKSLDANLLDTRFVELRLREEGGEDG